MFKFLYVIVVIKDDWARALYFVVPLNHLLYILAIVDKEPMT